MSFTLPYFSNSLTLDAAHKALNTAPLLDNYERGVLVVNFVYIETGFLLLCLILRHLSES
jgi:hypothetical protein